MSVGWGDKCSYYLDGQWVDVTDLVQSNADGAKNGDYVLTIEVDPFGRVVEKPDLPQESQAALCLNFNGSHGQDGQLRLLSRRLRPRLQQELERQDVPPLDVQRATH